MRIVRHKNFKKQYNKLPQGIKAKTNLAIKKFCSNPLDKSLRNHALKGSMHGTRAISVTGDVRIVFKEYDDYILVILLDVGTHSQVYS